MNGSTPPRKRPFRKRKADDSKGVTPRSNAVESSGESAPLDGARQDERGPAALLETTDATGDPVSTGTLAPVETTTEPSSTDGELSAAARARRLEKVKSGVRRSQEGAKAGIGYLADRVMDIAPRVPVRDLAALRRQFPGLGPEQLADKLIVGAANASSTVGAGVGAAAMLPVPPAMPAEMAAEITGVAAIELKLVAELHEVYGQRPPGGLKTRSTAYLTAWTEERGIDISKPQTMNGAFGGQVKRELRQQIMKRMVRNLPNLMPFMVGAAVGAVMNRRDTKKLAEKVRKDLRAHQVPWDALASLPALERPENPVDPLNPLLPARPAARDERP
ncbi:hypothetical protein [Streptomyces sp. KLOTTS4A1]|uniref:hypothetical protein n=1 Tax=Streptomyces sp. KLOTTS4A1 TaxID=3390996 RepID=UPI0039F47886